MKIKGVKSKGSDQLDNNKKQPIVISHTLRMVLNNCFGYQVYLTPLIFDPFDFDPFDFDPFDFDPFDFDPFDFDL
jgi:hypothetical protein